jgi:hypothetical protein
VEQEESREQKGVSEVHLVGSSIRKTPAEREAEIKKKESWRKSKSSRGK